MKKTLTAVVVAVFFLIPALCFSAYVIHLKDGREFTTSRYWMEGDQIKFKLPDGELGVPKDIVEKIDEVADAPLKEKAPEQETQARNEETPAEDKENKKGVSENGGASKANKGGKWKTEVIEDETLTKDANRYEKEKKALLEKKRALEKAYDDAREEGDMPARMRIRRALKEVDEKLAALGKKR